MQTYIILLTSIVVATVGQFLIKKGMMVLGSQEFDFKTIVFLIRSIFTNFYLFFGLVSYGLSFLFWMLALSKLKLSVAYPAVSLMYIFIMIGSYFIFKESISVYQIIGIILILTGLFFIFNFR